jgi:SpoVK/Ycf46/Vps4 family AAA+-type ATPase
MAGFKKQPTEQKPTVKKADGQSIEELKKELNEVSLEIKSLLGGTKDKNSLDFDTRGKLGNKYVHAATLAKEIAERTTNEKEQEEFFNYYKKWSKTAEGYGSAIQFDTSTTTLDDVKGLEEVKDLVRSFIFLAKNPTILEKYKIEGGFGLFMYGAPGTGKTMFAKAIAHELNLPLFVVEPSDIFKSYVGESEASVKRLFEQIEYCKTGNHPH